MLTSKSSCRSFSTASGGAVCRISAIQAGVAKALGERRLRNTWYISCSAFRPYLYALCVCQHMAAEWLKELINSMASVSL